MKNASKKIDSDSLDKYEHDNYDIDESQNNQSNAKTNLYKM